MRIILNFHNFFSAFHYIRTDLRSNVRISIVCSYGILIPKHFPKVAPLHYRHDSNRTIAQPKNARWRKFLVVALLRLALAILDAAARLTIQAKLGEKRIDYRYVFKEFELIEYFFYTLFQFEYTGINTTEKF